MTLDEKISLIHGARDPRMLGEAGYWPGLPRLGIPVLRLADGPPGVHANRNATAMPAPVGLAATFSAEAAELYGRVLGREARALEQDILLAPHVNIVRDPLFRRNHTALSEDPLLNARLAVAEIAGIQSQRVLAQVKHLAGYNGSDNVAIDERTLHEIYLPPFEAAVRAGVASVMCAYTRVNGAWSCESAELQETILRALWGFRGFVTSDWGAVRSPGAILTGMDLEMPGREIAGRAGGPYFIRPLKEAIGRGEIPVSAVDRAVTRILGALDRFGMLDAKRTSAPGRIDIAASAAAVRGIAEQAAVLLKNEGGALPLSAADLASLAVIGPTAGQLAAGFLGERGYGFESRLVSPLTALRRVAPRAKVPYAVGDDLTGAAIPRAALSGGLEKLPRGGATLEITLGPSLPTGVEYSWSGVLNVPAEGEYWFMVQPAISAAAGGSGNIAIDGRQVARSGGFFSAVGVTQRKWSSLLPTSDGRDNARGALRLTAGAHKIGIAAASSGTAPLSVRFAWTTPEFRRERITAAAALAAKARTAVVFAWSGGGETLALPGDQDALIEAVARANPRTVVVLNTGGAVATPWKDSVKAILQMWYPGQEGGWATADLLLGRVNPSGKLPVTFPARLEDAPARDPAHPERLAPRTATGGPLSPADAPLVRYSEGIFVGYRWYDAQNIVPLFPFGHGLSYTRFEYSGLKTTRGPSGIDVTFRVRNAGPRRGAEVAQAYLGPPAGAPAPMAPKSLAGFTRIELEPGRSAEAAIHIDARALSYWSVEKHDWAVAEGARRIYIGASSRDIRLSSEL